jgi:hypothetical protein
LFRRGTNGVARKNTPIATISAPAIVSSVDFESRRVAPRPVALMPSATNMIVNERQKMIAGPSTVDLFVPSRSSLIERPDTAER